MTIYVLWKECEDDSGVFGVGATCFDDIFPYLVDGFTLEGCVENEADIREMILDVCERLGYDRDEGETDCFEITWE